MMGRSVPEATIAVGRVRGMPFGRSRVEAAARQVRLIEAEGPEEVKAYALESLVEALSWSGEPTRAFPAFVKLLRWWDAHPEMFDEGDQNILFWEFSWIVSDLCRNPEVPPARVDAALNDMERRFALASRGVERAWACRLEWEMLRMGPDLARVFTTWLTLPIDEEDSCPACHEHHHAEYLARTGDLEGAVAIIEAALTQELSCSREPVSMLALLAWCYAELGRMDDVERVLPQVLSEARVGTSTSIQTSYALLVEVFGRGGAPDRALEMLSKLHDGMTLASAYVRFEVWCHVLAGARGLISQGYADYEITVAGLDASTVAELAVLADEEAVELAAAFDLRHGSTVQAERLSRARAVPLTTRPLRPAHADPASTQTNEADKAKVDEVSGNAASQGVSDSTPAEPAEPAESSTPDVEPSAEVQHAESAFRAGDHSTAADHYRQAAHQAQEEGHLAQAGWWWAEAARNEQEIGRTDVAAHDYTEAITRLRAGGATLEEIVPVFVAWAPAVERQSSAGFMRLAGLDFASPVTAETVEEFDTSPIPFTRGRIMGSSLFRRHLLALAEMEDSMARVVATWGLPADYARALELAHDAASRFATLGHTDSAAHAWWLSARIGDMLHHASARDDYVLSLQCFKTTGIQDRAAGRRAAVDYAAFLRNVGESKAASRIEAEWEEDKE